MIYFELCRSELVSIGILRVYDMKDEFEIIRNSKIGDKIEIGSTQTPKPGTQNPELCIPAFASVVIDISIIFSKPVCK